MLLSSASTCRIVALLRATEAPSGSWTLRKKAPWSSSGRKLVGVMRANPKMPAANSATSGMEIIATRIRRCTTRA